MTEPIKLTDADAAILRSFPVLEAWSALCREGLTNLGLIDDRGIITDLGRAALAAYDAEQRRAIRVEAMHECILAATAVKATAEVDGDEDDDVFDLAQERAYGAKLVLRAIADLIAKEESND